MKDLLGVSHSAASQQLAILRTHHLVAEKRQGRHVYYNLRKPELARWIIDGVAFISPDTSEIERMSSAIQSALTVWKPDKEVSVENSVKKKRAKA